MPLNARVFLAGALAPTAFVKVVGSVETPITFTVEPVGDPGGPVWVIPDAPLEPSTRYRVGYLEIVTGTEIDTSSPTLSSVVEGLGSIDGSCAEHLAARLAIAGSDDTTPPAEWLLKVVVSNGVSERIVYLPGYSPVVAHFLDDDWMDCAKLDIAEEGKAFSVTVTAYDWAGNASAPVELSVVFHHIDARGGGCAVGGAAPEGLMAWLALALAAMIGRRLRRSGREAGASSGASSRSDRAA